MQAGSINTLLHRESLLNWSLVLTRWESVSDVQLHLEVTSKKLTFLSLRSKKYCKDKYIYIHIHFGIT